MPTRERLYRVARSVPGARAAARSTAGMRLRALVESPGRQRDRADHQALRTALAAVLGPGSCCVDVGANVGDVLREMVRVAPQGHHVAFEPLPDLRAALCREFPAVEVRGEALCDQAGVREFVRVVDADSYSGLRERSYPRDGMRRERITVTAARLDDVLAPGYRPALIKIDVEGAELEVMRGGLETIAAARPVVVFEHGLGGADHYGATPAAVHEVLVTQAGLRIFDLAGNGPLSLGQFEEAFAAGRCWNFMARP